MATIFNTRQVMGGTLQIGFKLHLTETCDQEQPGLIINVETTAATTFDGTMTQVIHHALESKDLLANNIINLGACDPSGRGQKGK